MSPILRTGSPPRSPPDYTARGTRLRLFAVVAAVMLVLALVEHAGDLRAWYRTQSSADGSSSQGTSRWMPPPMRTAGDPSGTFVAVQNEQPPSQPPAPGGEADDHNQAWDRNSHEVFRHLSPDQQTLLFEILHATASRQSVPESRSVASASLIADLNRLWQAADLPAEAVSEANRRWVDNLQPALQAILDGRTLTEREEQALAAWQRTLDAAALAQVQDDTVFLRPAERPIWLRLAAQMREGPDAAEPVSYVQLFQQPAEYRGQAVTIHGVVKRAYAVRAAENYLGIERYFVLWILPAGGETSPIVVYALDLPAGFPLPEAGQDEPPPKLHEEVEVTGYFLKRGAYLGRDGTYTAPLVIAGPVKWTPGQPALADLSKSFGGLAGFWPSVAVAAAIAAAIFGLAYWRIRASEAEARQIVAAGRSRWLPEVRDMALRPSAAEALKQMEEDARRRR